MRVAVLTARPRALPVPSTADRAWPSCALACGPATGTSALAVRPGIGRGACQGRHGAARPARAGRRRARLAVPAGDGARAGGRRGWRSRRVMARAAGGRRGWRSRRVMAREPAAGAAGGPAGRWSGACQGRHGAARPARDGARAGCGRGWRSGEPSPWWRGCAGRRGQDVTPRAAARRRGRGIAPRPWHGAEPSRLATRWALVATGAAGIAIGPPGGRSSRPARQVLPSVHQAVVRHDRRGRYCHGSTRRSFVEPVLPGALQAVT